MTFFWLIGGALAAVALFLVLRPLLGTSGPEISRREANIAIYRDQLRELEADLRAGTLAQADYDRARRELEARLLEDAAAPAQAGVHQGGRGTALALAAAIPVLAVLLYLAVGSPAALAPQADEHAATARQVEAMVERLAARLRENPDDADGWKLLGRSYGVLGRYPEAADAYAKAAVRAPRDAQLLADFADALAMARGSAGAGNLFGEPEKLIARALEIDPKNLKALALAGTAAFARRDYAAAAATWEKMLPLVAADSEDARSIRASIDEAKALVKNVPLRGVVRLAATLKGKAAPEDTVFIFARAAEGPAVPLAVLRRQVRDLPLKFALDDSMAMAPGMRLSGFARVIVSARVSKSGDPKAQPGDLQGASAPVAHDAAGVSVVIDSVVR
ncbi:MAG: c-type cytochrome biogenesis protein CcmI [Burkholderiales bacterium]